MESLGTGTRGNGKAFAPSGRIAADMRTQGVTLG